MNPENGPNGSNDTEAEQHFPSFEEHMRELQTTENDAETPSQPDYDYVFRNMSPEDRPEGVRDAQDLKEYTEEREAKQAESIEKQKSIILENYNVPDEEVDALVSSEEFAAFCRSGITIDDLVSKDVITSGKKYHIGEQPDEKAINDLFETSAFDDMRMLVEELGERYACKESMDKYGAGNDEEFPEIKNYIDKLDDPSSITKEDTVKLAFSTRPNSGIIRRLLFSNPNDFDVNNVVERTSMTLNHIKNYEIDDSDYSFDDMVGITEFLDLADSIIEEADFFNDNTDNYAGKNNLIRQALRPRLREAVRAHTEMIARYMDHDDTSELRYYGNYVNYDRLKNLVLRSTSELSIMKDHDILTQAGISEEELLDSVYGFDNKELSKYKSRPEAYPDHHIARDAGSLIEHGFSKNSIVDAIHDNSIYIDEYEVERMRNAGIEDEDIIYAKGVDHLAYEYNRNGDKIDNDEIEIDGVKYSQKDVLGAALKEIRYRNLHE